MRVMKRFPRLVKDILLTFSTQILIFCFGIPTSIILARSLGPEGKGEFTLITLLPSMLVLGGNLGLDISNVYFAGRERTKRDTIKTISSNSIIVALGLGAIYILLITVFIYLTPNLYQRFFHGVAPRYMLIATGMIPLMLLTQYFRYILLGLNKIVQYNVILLCQAMVMLLGIYVLIVILRQGVFGAMVGWVLCTAIIGGLSIFVLSKVTKIGITPRGEWLQRSLKFGLKNYPGMVAQAMNYRLAMFLVNFFLSVAFVAYYSIAVSLAELLWYIPAAIGVVLIPKITASDLETQNRTTSVLCRNSFFITLILTITLALISKPLITFVFGAAFLPAVKPLLFLLPGVLILSIPKVLSNDLIGRGYPLIGTYAALSSLMITIPLDIVLLPRLGIAGAAIASSISYAVNAMVVTVAFVKISKVSLVDILVIKMEDLSRYADLCRLRFAIKILRREWHGNSWHSKSGG